MYENLAAQAVFAFLYSVVAGGVERTTITGPILFTVFGLVFVFVFRLRQNQYR